MHLALVLLLSCYHNLGILVPGLFAQRLVYCTYGSLSTCIKCTTHWSYFTPSRYLCILQTFTFRPKCVISTAGLFGHCFTKHLPFSFRVFSDFLSLPRLSGIFTPYKRQRAPPRNRTESSSLREKCATNITSGAVVKFEQSSELSPSSSTATTGFLYLYDTQYTQSNRNSQYCG